MKKIISLFFYFNLCVLSTHSIIANEWNNNNTNNNTKNNNANDIHTVDLTNNFAPKKSSSFQSSFIENKGQWASEVKFLFRNSNYNLWITDYGFVYDYFDIYQSESTSQNNELNDKFEICGDVLIIKFTDKNNFIDKDDSFTNDNSFINKLSFVAKGEQPTKYNYFIGNDSSKWVTNVALYNEIIAENVFDGIDVRYYLDAKNQNQIRYDFELKPNANPQNIQLEIFGAEQININSKGELEIITKNRTYIHNNLFAFQEENGHKKQVECHFVKNTITNNNLESNNLKNNKLENNHLELNNSEKTYDIVCFTVGEYDKNQPLIIDPLIYSVVIGDVAYDVAYNIATDTAGYAYIAGTTRSQYFPQMYGNYSFNQKVSGNYTDAFISKINAKGDTLIYSTFIGGGDDDNARYIKVDNAFNIYVVGETKKVFPDSLSFPTRSSNSNLRIHNGGWDVFLIKIREDGYLVFSVLLGSDNNDWAGGFELDKNKNCIIAAKIDNCMIKPTTTTNAYNSTYSGGASDGYVAIIDSTGSILKHATLFGGSGADEPKSLTIDTNKNVYITGITTSANFPTLNPYQQTIKGLYDAFVTKFDSTLSNLIYSTYIGGSAGDTVACISLDKDNCAYITGYTNSNNFPTTFRYNNDTLKKDAANIFITKFNNVGNALEYSTSITSVKSNWTTGIVVDTLKNAHIVGYTNSINYPVTWDAFFYAEEAGGNSDAIYTVFDSTGKKIIFSSFIGGEKDDKCFGLALDKKGVAYIGGGTVSGANFPHSIAFADSNFVKYDTIRYDTIRHDSTYDLIPVLIPVYEKRLGDYDVFVFKASYKAFPGELETNIDSKGSQFCPGTTLNIEIIANGFYYKDNVFKIQLSDVNGNFPDNPNIQIIDSVKAYYSLSTNLTFPANLNSEKYRIRVISTHPRGAGNPSNYLDISPPYVKLDSMKVPPSACLGKQIKIPLSTNPCFNADNKYNLELSDATGSFANPIVLATIMNGQDTFNVKIDNIASNENYKIRCLATSPVKTSNELNFAIVHPLISFDSIDFSSIQSLCDGENFEFNFIATNCFESSNIFYLIISDTLGNFTNNVDTVGSISSTGSYTNSTIHGKIPNNFPFSENYKMKIVSTNPKQDTTVNLNFALGKPYIYIDELTDISICKDLETPITLKVNNCFNVQNVFKIFIYNGNNWLMVGESKPDEKNITVLIPENFQIGSTKIVIETTNPPMRTNEIPVNIIIPQISIDSIFAINGLCANSSFEINCSANKCVTDSLNIIVEISDETGSFDYSKIDSSKIIGIGKIFGKDVKIKAALPDIQIGHYLIRCVAINDLDDYLILNEFIMISNEFNIEILPSSVEISTDISDLQVLCNGIGLYIDFETTGCFENGNIFQIILSDIDGNFNTSDSKVIGDTSLQASGRIFVEIPMDVTEGNKYRLLISSSIPELTKVLEFDIEIKDPFINIDTIGNIDFCYGMNNPIDSAANQSQPSFVRFSTSDCYSNDNGNIFILQIAPNGDFSQAINLDTCSTNEQGFDEREFNFFLPNNLQDVPYRFRIISSSPSIVGADNGYDIRFKRSYASLSGSINPVICRGSSTVFAFESTPCFDTNNIFYIELSDKYGNFQTPLLLDSCKNTTNGIFNFEIPDTIAFGDFYKFRIISSSPLDTFVQSEINFTVGIPEILTGNLSRILLARNDTIHVPFNTNCFGTKDRKFAVQLSDPFGTFNNILEIGEQIGWGEKGTIFARIHLLASDGYAYRVRVVSKEPTVIGNDNGKNIIIVGIVNTDIDNDSDIQTYFIFPNPFDTQISIRVSEEFFNEILQINIYDLLGQLRIIHSISEFNNQAILIPTKDLENGTYLIVIETKTQRISTLMIKNSF